MADEADRSVVMALLLFAFLGKRDKQGLGSQSWPFSCMSYFVAFCGESRDYILSKCFDLFR